MMRAVGRERNLDAVGKIALVGEACILSSFRVQRRANTDQPPMLWALVRKWTPPKERKNKPRNAE